MTAMIAYVRVDRWDDHDLPDQVEGVYPTVEAALVAAGPGEEWAEIGSVDGRRLLVRNHRYGSTVIEEFPYLAVPA